METNQKILDPTNRGQLFKNDNQAEKQPDMKGTLNVNGVEYWISGWKKTSKAGTGFISLSIRPKQEQTRQVSQATRKTTNDDWDDF